MSCDGSCEDMGYLKGAVTVILGLMVMVTMGMAYALLQNHRVDTNLILLTDTVSDNNHIFVAARNNHAEKLTDLNKRVDRLNAKMNNVSVMCCDDPHILNGYINGH